MLKKLQNHSLTLAVDIDGILANSDIFIRWMIHQDFNMKIEYEMLKPEKSYSEFLTEKQLDYVIDMLHREYAIDLIPEMEDAKASLKKLSKDFNIKLITNRPASSKDTTVKWLDKHNFYYNQIIFTPDKQKHLSECFCLVEDNYKNSLSAVETGCNVVLFSYNWNTITTKEHPMIRRIDAPSYWKKAVPLIKQIAANSILFQK